MNNNAQKKDHIKTTARGAAVLDLEGFQGITENEAKARQQQDGFNELPSQQKRGLFPIVFEVMREPMFLMLVKLMRLF